MRGRYDLSRATMMGIRLDPLLAGKDLQQQLAHWIGDAADDAAPDAAPKNQEQYQNRHAVSLERRQNRPPEWWEQCHENARAIEWRQGNHVERREAEVDEHEDPQELLDLTQVHARC